MIRAKYGRPVTRSDARKWRNIVYLHGDNPVVKDLSPADHRRIFETAVNHAEEMWMDMPVSIDFMLTDAFRADREKFAALADVYGAFYPFELWVATIPDIDWLKTAHKKHGAIFGLGNVTQLEKAITVLQRSVDPDVQPEIDHIRRMIAFIEAHQPEADTVFWRLRREYVRRGLPVNDYPIPECMKPRPPPPSLQELALRVLPDDVPVLPIPGLEAARRHYCPTCERFCVV